MAHNTLCLTVAPYFALPLPIASLIGASFICNMELIFAHQIGFDQLRENQFDYFIAASGYENRCTYLIDSISINATHKIALAFNDKKAFLFRKKNDKRFSDERFIFIEESVGENSKIIEFLDNVIIENKGFKKIKILIDYSCMSKVWYAGILEYFIFNEVNTNDLEIYFSYSSAVFSEPVNPEKNNLPKDSRELLRVNHISHKPLALILGLGYEKYITQKLIQKFDYKSIFAFYSDPAFDNRYADRVLKNNKNILSKLPDEHIIKYPIGDFKQTDNLLTSLTISLRLNYQVAILPIGPKPFTLSSLLLAARYPDIEVWSIDPGFSPPAYNRNPTGEPMVCKVVFSNDEDSFL